MNCRSEVNSWVFLQENLIRSSEFLRSVHKKVPICLKISRSTIKYKMSTPLTSSLFNLIVRYQCILIFHYHKHQFDVK